MMNIQIKIVRKLLYKHYMMVTFEGNAREGSVWDSPKKFISFWGFFYAGLDTMKIFMQPRNLVGFLFSILPQRRAAAARP